MLTRLDADGRLVVVGADRARGADDDEAALGLRLEGPGIGERAPARLELGEADGVARDGDAVLVHLQARGLIDDGGDFDRRAPP